MVDKEAVPVSRNATLVDVARVANVSVSTAARVLRNAEYPVDPKLKEQVEIAAKHVGYVPNLIARRLRGGGQQIVGLVVGNMMDAHYGVIAETVTSRAEVEHSTVAIVCNMQRDPLLEIKYCRKLLEYRVGGIILSGGGFDQWTYNAELAETIKELDRAGIVVASLMPRDLEVPVFSVDNEAVGRTMAEFVVAKGHTKVGVLLGPARNNMTRLRMQTMTGMLSGNVVDFSITHIESTAQAGAEAAAQMIARNPDFTALIAGSDAIAFGAVTYLKEQGIDVPGRISVMGLGNTRLAQLSSPTLTTIETNFALAGQEALDFITRPKLADPSSAGMIIPHSLVLGDSFASLRG